MKKTYSTKAKIDNQGKKRRARKEPPKFDELFLNKNQSNHVSTYSFEDEWKINVAETSSHVSQSESSGDTFDKLFKGTKVKSKLKSSTSYSLNPTSVEDSKTISDSSDDILFTSPAVPLLKRAGSNKSPDMFLDNSEVIKPKKQKYKQQRKPYKSVVPQRRTHTQTKENNPVYKSPIPASDVKEATSINTLDIIDPNNLKTSTPFVQKPHKGKDVIETFLSSVVSPVPFNSSRIIFEDSSSIDSDFDAVCNNDNDDAVRRRDTEPTVYFDALDRNNSYQSHQAGPSVIETLPLCSVLLERLDHNSKSSFDHLCSKSSSRTYMRLKQNRITRRREPRRRQKKTLSSHDRQNSDFKQVLESSRCKESISDLTHIKLTTDPCFLRPSTAINETSHLRTNYSSSMVRSSLLGKSWKRSITFCLRNLQITNASSTKANNSMRAPRPHEISIVDISTSEFVNVFDEDAKILVMGLCDQDAYIPLKEYFSQSVVSRAKKIGEGVYGEVYMILPEDGPAKPSLLPQVCKLLPIEGHLEMNGEPQKTFGEISSEIVISIELSKMNESSQMDNCCPSFVLLSRINCIQGSYSEQLLKHWDNFHKEKGSENDRPDNFDGDQLHIALQFEHAGKDLESFIFTNAVQAHALFMQIAFGLAAAEEKLEFEHRDLHWGNVLVSHSKEASFEYRVNKELYTIPSKGVKAKIIDFTLSRLRINEERIYFYDLSKDPSMFTAEGDLQFDIYREMRRINGDDWQKFQPRTNILWLHYILHKMISECYYKNIKTKIHKKGISLLKELSNVILDYSSAYQFILHCP